MTAVHPLLERARRRLLVNQALAVCSRAVPAAGFSMLAWILCSRWFLTGREVEAFTSPWFVLALGAAILLAFAAALLARRGWPSHETAAAQLDERLQLASRLSTALAVGARTDAFSRAAVADANRVAEMVDAARGIPIEFDSPWSGRWRPSLVSLALVAAAWLFIPDGLNRALPTNTQALQDAPTLEKALAEQRRLQDAMQSALELSRLDASIAKALESAREAMDQANQSNATPAEREAVAFEQQALLAAALERASQSEPLQSHDAFRDALAELEMSPGEERELLSALKRGDFDAADKEARRLFEAAHGNNPDAQSMTVDQAKNALEKASRALKSLAAAQAAKANRNAKPASGSPPKPFSTAAKRCDSLREACDEAAKGDCQKLLDMCKDESNKACKKSMLSKSLGACRNPGSNPTGAPGNNDNPNFKLADEPDQRNTQFETAPVMSESQDLESVPVASDFVLAPGAANAKAERALQAIQQQVRAGLEQGSQEEQVPSALRTAHQRYFSQWKRKLDSAKTDQNEVAPAPSNAPGDSRAPAAESSKP